MPDDVKKNQDQNPKQSGQPQQENPQDVSKRNPSQEGNEQNDDKQKQQDQGGQRRAS
jgi:hypothetical protein